MVRASYKLNCRSRSSSKRPWILSWMVSTFDFIFPLCIGIWWQNVFKVLNNILCLIISTLWSYLMLNYNIILISLIGSWIHSFLVTTLHLCAIIWVTACQSSHWNNQLWSRALTIGSASITTQAFMHPIPVSMNKMIMVLV